MNIRYEHERRHFGSFHDLFGYFWCHGIHPSETKRGVADVRPILKAHVPETQFSQSKLYLFDRLNSKCLSKCKHLLGFFIRHRAGSVGKLSTEILCTVCQNLHTIFWSWSLCFWLLQCLCKPLRKGLCFRRLCSCDGS